MEGKLQKLSKESLESLNDNELEYELFLYIIEKLIRDNYVNKYSIITKLPIGLKYFYASWELEAEVLNGGFNQYFFNTLGEFINEAIESFIYFELPVISCIINKAAEIALAEIDLHINTRKEGTLEAFSESYKYTHLGDADDRFYNFSDDISMARIKKIRNSVIDFII